MSRRFERKLLWAAPLGFLLACFANFRYAGLLGGQASRLVLGALGGVVSVDGVDILQALAFSLVFVIQLTLLGNACREDFEIASAYLFTRGEKRGRWLARKLLSMAAQSTGYYFILFAAVLGCLPLLGYAWDGGTVWLALAWLLPTLALTNTVLVMAVSLLTLRLRVPVTYTLAIALYTGWIALLPLMKGFEPLWRLCPVTHSMLLLHQLPAALGEEIEQAVSLRIPLGETFLALLLGGGVLYALGYAWLKQTDLWGRNDP